MIQPYILDRLRNSGVGGDRLATLLSQLATSINHLGLPGGAISLEFTQPGDPLEPGDLIPSIQLTLTRVTHDPKTPGPPAPETTA